MATIRASSINRRRWLLSTPVWYVYPIWHTVSFTIVAKNHLRELKKYFRIYEIDELAFPLRDVYCKPVVIIHPYFFIVQRRPQLFFNKIPNFKAVIGIDVADTDQIGKIAVQLCNLATAMITHSTFCKEVYVKSGVKVPVYVVPHGLDKIFYEPRKTPQHKHLQELYKLKQKNKYIYILFFLWHSGERKGADLVYKVVKEISKMYSNVKLIIKVGIPMGYHYELLKSITKFIITDFLSQHDLVALYDMCDIYLLFSRGGGFELNGLEALSRGEVVLAGAKGSWTDYLPDFLLIKKVHRVKFWAHTNPITDFHCGYGYEVDVEEAINKLKEVIENLVDYKARVREYWNKVKHQWSWEAVGLKLKSIIEKYI